MIVYIAQIQQIPESVKEAARIDGANSWQLMRYIILPLMMPAFTIGLFLSISSSFKMFDQNLALTQGGPYKSTEMIALNIYNSAFGANEFGFAQAKAIVFLIIVAGIGVTQLVITKRKEVEMYEEKNRLWSNRTYSWMHFFVSDLYFDYEFVQDDQGDFYRCVGISGERNIHT